MVFFVVRSIYSAFAYVRKEGALAYGCCLDYPLEGLDDVQTGPSVARPPRHDNDVLRERMRWLEAVFAIAGYSKVIF